MNLDTLLSDSSEEDIRDSGRSFQLSIDSGDTSTSYTLPSHLTTIARGGGGCCMRKREYDRKDRSIVDRKPEENEKFWPMHFHSSILNQAACLEGTRAPEVPDSTCLRIS